MIQQYRALGPSAPNNNVVELSSYSRPTKRPRHKLKTVNTISAVAGKYISAKQRIRMSFQALPDNIRNYSSANPITVEMHRLERDFQNEHDAATAASTINSKMYTVMSQENQNIDLDVIASPPSEIGEPSFISSQDALIGSDLLLGLSTIAPSSAWICICDQILDLKSVTAAVTNRQQQQQELPPFEKVICRIQNWLYVVRYVLDRLSSERAFRQARIDLLKKRDLLKWWHKTTTGGSTVAINSMTNTDWRLMFTKYQISKGWTLPNETQTTKTGLGWDVLVPRCTHTFAAASFALHGNKSAIESIADTICLDPHIGGTKSDTPRPSLHLRSLVYAMLNEGARYDVTYFASMRRSSIKPKAASLVHDSGKVVSTGGKSPEEAAWTLRKLARSLRAAGSLPLRVNPDEASIENIVASMVLPFFVDLRKLSQQCGIYCTYRPDSFPGATVRIKELDGAKGLFYRTSAVLPGSKTVDDLRKALKVAVEKSWRARIQDLNSEASVAALSVSARQVAQRLSFGESGLGAVNAATQAAAVATVEMYETDHSGGGGD